MGMQFTNRRDQRVKRIETTGTLSHQTFEGGEGARESNQKVKRRHGMTTNTYKKTFQILSTGSELGFSTPSLGTLKGTFIFGVWVTSFKASEGISLKKHLLTN